MKARHFIFGAVLLSITACDLDVFPTGSMTQGQMSESKSAPEYATNANYAFFKDGDPYAKGTDAGNTYIRHYFQMAEYPADNSTLSGRTEDVLYEITCLKNNSSLSNIQAFWYFAYRIISGANGVITTVKDGESPETDQLKGENYFIRAVCELHLATLFCKPYTSGRENLGIVLRTGDNTAEIKRVTVGETYDQIVDDLKNAIRLMNRSRGDKGYATKEAAQGLLSRVYLYMEMNQEVVDLVDEMLSGADPISKLEIGEGYKTYFANTRTSKETLWCVALQPDESKGQEMMGSMYLKDGTGWGEVYCSDPLCNLYERYPADIRYSTYILPQYKGDGKKQVSFPIPGEDDCRLTAYAEAKLNTEGKYAFTYGGKNYVVETEKINGMGQPDANGEYDNMYVNYNGEKINARVTESIENRSGYTFLMYFMSKFSYQDGDPMLCSPAMIRWGEVILNRAEAYAKLGNDKEALDDVNIIRKRAEIPEEGMFSLSNMHGYGSVLDVVLDERRLELAFEGHRMFDVYRNKRAMDRRFAGVQPWEVVRYDDPRTILPIPYNEITVSHIPQNDGF